MEFDSFLPVPGLTLKAVNHDPPASSGLGWLAGREGLTKQSANLLNNNKQSCVSRLKKSQETPQGKTTMAQPKPFKNSKHQRGS